MIIQSLKLHDFRCYEDIEISFDKGLNLVLGPNGVGKSCLVEAIGYLSLAKSWRNSDESSLIRQNCHGAYIKASIVEGALIRDIEIELSRKGKRISVNGKKISRLSELSKLVNVIVFSPADVPLFAASPGERRKFLDVAISKVSQPYFLAISDYGKLLFERNALLKDPYCDRNLLEVITSKMIELSKPIVEERLAYVSQLNSVLPETLERLFGSKKEIELSYKSFIPVGDDYYEQARLAFSRSLDSDLRHGSTSVGPQREDISLIYQGKDIAKYGSQGENRSAVLALKLSPYFLIIDEAKKPILVLDDVFSELDQAKTDSLTECLKGLSQTFVTATQLNVSDASIYEVSAIDNRSIRRK